MDTLAVDWMYYGIAMGHPLPKLFANWKPIPPCLLVAAGINTLRFGGEMEFCLCNTAGIYYITICIEDGRYLNHTVGSAEIAHLEDGLERFRGQMIDDIAQELKQLMAQVTSRRVVTWTHPNSIGAITVIPDWYGRPISYHTSNKASGVFIEHPATGFDQGRVEYLPERSDDDRMTLLRLVNDVGPDATMTMSDHQASRWLFNNF